MPPTDWLEFTLWLLRRRRRVRIFGRSMLPLLQHGEEVLIDPTAYCDRPPNEGDVVVAYHLCRPDLYLVKRVIAVSEGTAILIGDNPTESHDSQQFGAIPLSLIVGKVTSRFGKGDGIAEGS